VTLFERALVVSIVVFDCILILSGLIELALVVSILTTFVLSSNRSVTY
jgi:hypothetical protein